MVNQLQPQPALLHVEALRIICPTCRFPVLSPDSDPFVIEDEWQVMPEVIACAECGTMIAKPAWPTVVAPSSESFPIG